MGCGGSQPYSEENERLINAKKAVEEEREVLRRQEKKTVVKKANVEIKSQKTVGKATSKCSPNMEVPSPQKNKIAAVERKNYQENLDTEVGIHGDQIADLIRIQIPQRFAPLFKAVDFLSLVEEKVNQLMKGTREWIISDVLRWLKDKQASKVFWLAGNGGTGKSVISASVLCRLEHLCIAW